MKKNLSRSLMLTAVALTLGVAAYGQQSPHREQLPFAFRTSGVNHSAGDYAVILNSSAVYQLMEEATGKAVYLGAGVPEGGEVLPANLRRGWCSVARMTADALFLKYGSGTAAASLTRRQRRRAHRWRASGWCTSAKR